MGLVKPLCSISWPALPSQTLDISTLVVQTLSPYPNHSATASCRPHWLHLQTFNLLAAFTALDNVLLAMLFTNIVPKPARRQRAIALLSGWTWRQAETSPGPIIARRAAACGDCRALANQPPLLLADEPCASLDSPRRPGARYVIHHLSRAAPRY